MCFLYTFLDSTFLLHIRLYKGIILRSLFPEELLLPQIFSPSHRHCNGMKDFGGRCGATVLQLGGRGAGEL